MNKVRQAVRGLLVTEKFNKVLLLRVNSAVMGDSIWMTPGGGIKNLETEEQALRREIWEETGLEINGTCPVVFTRTFVFQTGTGVFRQFEKYYLVFVDEFKPTMTNNPEEQERKIFQEYHWWSIDEISKSSMTFAPSSLGPKLKQLEKDLRNSTANYPLDISER